MDTATVNEAFESLDRWVVENRWRGYDPYDIRGQDWYVRLFGAQNIYSRKLRGALTLLEKRLPPQALRNLLRIPRQVNAKAMGLFASAYLLRWQMTGDRHYEDRSRELLAWLIDNQSTGFPGMSWGYPFHWQSRIFLPRGTPSIVVTATVGDAWLKHYELTRSPRSLAVLEGIAEFILHGLNRPVDDGDRLCFSYTPLDQFRVHNASLFGAAFLARMCEITGREDFGELAMRAARYTLSEQNDDGSFHYWGSEPPTIIDHYHTGFVLRHLDTIRIAMSADSVEPPLERGFTFYHDRMFTDDSVPKFTPESRYPVDIHACAEALICIAQLGPHFGRLERLQPVFEFTQNRMRTTEGWYMAAVELRGGKERDVHVPFMRWGQAWMLLAFARLQALLTRTPADHSEPQCASE